MNNNNDISNSNNATAGNNNDDNVVLLMKKWVAKLNFDVKYLFLFSILNLNFLVFFVRFV